MLSVVTTCSIQLILHCVNANLAPTLVNWVNEMTLTLHVVATNQLMLPWQRFKVRRVKMTFFQNNFVNFDFRNRNSKYELVTPPIFVIFHPQTTEIQPFKVEYFSTKTLKFRQHDVIIYDVSADFGIFLVCARH